jgi:His/Glu/Gln/Arg/opine family amino acid ABC transporter permease subunit
VSTFFELLEGAPNTLIVTGGAFALALVGGLILALLQSYGGVLGGFARLYTNFFRGAPVLVQLFILFFGLAEFGIRLRPLQAAIIGLGMNGASYIGEIIRAGIESVHRGQTEAALSVGLTRWQVMRHIVLPQTVSVSLPPIGNQLISLLKDSAIVSVVAAPEITFRARQIATRTFRAGEVYLIAAGLYLALSLPLAAAVRHLERRRTRYREQGAQRPRSWGKLILWGVGLDAKSEETSPDRPATSRTHKDR